MSNELLMPSRENLMIVRPISTDTMEDIERHANKKSAHYASSYQRLPLKNRYQKNFNPESGTNSVIGT